MKRKGSALQVQWRFSGGILAGFAVLGILSGAFTISLYNWIPVVEPYFKLAGACYLIYLALQVGFIKNKKQDSTEARSSFISGFIFQLINIKSILFFLTVMSAFVLPFNHSLKSTIYYLALAIVLGWLAVAIMVGIRLRF